MHADSLGVYSLTQIKFIEEDTTFGELAHVTMYSREKDFEPIELEVNVYSILKYEPTYVPAKTARNLLKLLQRKLP